MDLAAYLLSPLERLGGVKPWKLDEQGEVGEWIRRTEMSWSPGLADHRNPPWLRLRSCGSDAELVLAALEEAAHEIKTADPRSPIHVIARQRLPRTTLMSFLGADASQAIDYPCADIHVHQGAALPLEVVLHAVASQMTSASDAGQTMKVLCDIDGTQFDPCPLLLAMRALLELHPEWPASLGYALQAAKGSAESGDQLRELLDFDRPSGRLPDLEAVIGIKEDARARWTDARRVALYRIEAIMLGAISQRAPGLDVFVDLFERLSSLRRERFPKERYFEQAIRVHCKQSTTLRAMELRLGESIHSVVRSRAESLAAEYLFALSGYHAFAVAQDDPVRVTFPLGLVKTKSATASRPEPEHWRFDPGGIYDIVESLIEILEACPSVAPFVDGLDVCGREEDVPNWLFAPAFERFARWSTSRRRVMTCRFHAGEFQASPLHGLRRIAEVLDFRIARSTPLRIGHALALRSDDWTRLEEQPIDELLDDLVWALSELRAMDGVSAELERALERGVYDALPKVYPSAERLGAGVRELQEAYRARQNPVTLERIGFLQRTDGRLSFADYRPSPDDCSIVERLVIEHLARRTSELPRAKAHFEWLGPLQLHLAEAYRLLARDLAERMRWRGAVIEVCPTSNVLVGGIRGYGGHPLAQLIDDGNVVAVGSDDPSMFHAFAADEIAATRDFMGLSRRRAARLQASAIELVGPDIDGEEVTAMLCTAIDDLRELAPAALSGAVAESR